MQVETILQSKGHAVFTVEAVAPLSEAIAILNGKKIGAVVVVDAKARSRASSASVTSSGTSTKDPVALARRPGAQRHDRQGHHLHLWRLGLGPHGNHDPPPRPPHPDRR